MNHTQSVLAAVRPTTADPLRAHRVTKTFGTVRALEDVSLDLAPGEAVSVMGPSGSGKSTLLHCLAGILPPDSGTIALGQSVFSDAGEAARSRVRRERFGFVFQDHQLLPELPAEENVALPLMLTGTPRRQAVGAARDWLARFGLTGLEGRRPGELSGGQAQRVAIARSLVTRPAVVFADEPTGALDQATGHDVMHVLRAATSDLGATLVVVTHDRQVAGWCGRHIALRDGRIVSDTGR